MENWHSLKEEDVFSKLSTSANGLDSNDAKRRIIKYGFNEPIVKKKRNLLWQFLAEFKSPLVYLLIASAIVTYSIGRYIDTVVILVIVIANAFIGFFQELKAEKSLEALKRLVCLKAKVLRDEEENEIPALDLVPGDIVILQAGAKVPADLRLLKVQNLKIDESALTGESVPTTKQIKILSEGELLANRVNMAYSSTVIATGHGLGVVVETGARSEIGKIAKDVLTIKEEKTPLYRRLGQFSTYLLVITLAVCFLIFVLGVLRGQNVIDMLLTSVAAAVAAIPEGLPAVITITLAIGVRRMAEKNSIVRKLQAIDTLGSITIIASDKTGTLTYNQMTVEKMHLPSGKIIKISGKGYQPQGKFFLNRQEININNLKDAQKNLLVGLLCNDATLIKEKNQWKILGDPTEGALITMAAKAKLFKDKLNQKFPRIDEIPFDSEWAYMATLNSQKSTKNIIAVKGTLEKILTSSTYSMQNGKIKKLHKPAREKIFNDAHKEAAGGYRIIAFAYKDMQKSTQKITSADISKLIFLGFFAIDDPPRKETNYAIEKCRLSGIKPLMITGDYPATALAVAKRIGMIEEHDQQVLTEEQVAKMTLPQLARMAKNTSVFARITPHSKLKIVEALQRDNEIVAVTGDGVNDAPVLKKSNVGIAMGIGGTDVAREAADIVLADNNFSSIISAIEEGRTIFLNIRRVIFYLLSTNAGEILILIVALLMGVPMPLTAVQILWINLVTDTSAAVSLAVEPKHIGVTQRSPRSMEEGIVDSISYWRIFLVAIIVAAAGMILYLQAISAGHSVKYARSVAFVTIAVFQIFNVLNARSMKTSLFKLKPFSNIYVIYAVLVSFILTILTTEWEVLRNLFHTTHLPFMVWLEIILAGFCIIILVELDKYIRNRLK